MNVPRLRFRLQSHGDILTSFSKRKRLIRQQRLVAGGGRIETSFRRRLNRRSKLGRYSHAHRPVVRVDGATERGDLHSDWTTNDDVARQIVDGNVDVIVSQATLALETNPAITKSSQFRPSDRSIGIRHAAKNSQRPAFRFRCDAVGNLEFCRFLKPRKEIQQKYSALTF